jgi:hypothetical protein
MKRVLIITGPAGDSQGRGNLEVTKIMCGTPNPGAKSLDIDKERYYE